MLTFLKECFIKLIIHFNFSIFYEASTLNDKKFTTQMHRESLFTLFFYMVQFALKSLRVLFFKRTFSRIFICFLGFQLLFIKLLLFMNDFIDIFQGFTREL